MYNEPRPPQEPLSGNQSDPSLVGDERVEAPRLSQGTPPQYTPPPMRPPQMPYTPPPPPPSSGSGGGIGRTVFYVLSSVSVGFFLPICGCLFFCLVSFAGLSALSATNLGDDESGPAVGVVELVGPISAGGGFGASTESFQAQLDYMAENDDVEAVVIRANSPGGGVTASDEMWYAVEQFRQDTGKPVVVYMQGTCASGCLYVAAAADELFANRNSLVGSIGVISTFFNAEELFNEIGVEPQVIATGDSKDFGSFYRELTPDEEEYWRGQIGIVLDNFIDVVATRDGSTLSVSQVTELANGRVWIASEALNLGLIDQIGYEDNAIDYAASLAGMNDYRVLEYPFNFNFAEFFTVATDLEELDGYFALPTANDLINSMQQPPLQYRYLGPYDQPNE